MPSLLDRLGARLGLITPASHPTMRCPDCNAPLEIPRKAWYVPGSYDVQCPNGHAVTIDRGDLAT
jgi:hypothetical protein